MESSIEKFGGAFSLRTKKVMGAFASLREQSSNRSRKDANKKMEERKLLL